ncbi:hypothetical protein SAMN05878282_103456 [Aquipseudomonas alcaligenes]|uniref:Uncharacterized protein n=1 Tax=Aquipseudomonas alcaligenes TaxID=43263 RepID=A0A1N6SBK0_AQUAC|nr:hypothetical protein SAMN05878282_103456 [Pseudomonas alcaligenes]
MGVPELNVGLHRSPRRERLYPFDCFVQPIVVDRKLDFARSELLYLCFERLRELAPNLEKPSHFVCDEAQRDKDESYFLGMPRNKPGKKAKYKIFKCLAPIPGKHSLNWIPRQQVLAGQIFRRADPVLEVNAHQCT